MCFKNVQPFLGKSNETLLVLKDLQTKGADKASRPRLGISLKKKNWLAIFSKRKTQLGS